MVAVGEWWWVPDEEQCFVPARVTSVAGADASLDADGAPVSCPTAKLTTKIDSPDLLDAQLDDLVQMDQVNHPAIIDTLRRRYRSDKIYTGIADILVAMNPFKWLPVYTPAHVTEYAKGDQEAPPHPFKTTMNAYNGLRESRCAQAILISGESGAGKTETTKQCLKMLSECAGGGRKGEAGVEERLLSTNPVLETLGNAKTVRNDNSSRFGKFMQIHFDSNFRIAGCDVVDYLLEKSRVTSPGPNERSYHVFYQLCKMAAGRKGLVDASEYPYLAKSGCVAVHAIDDGEEWKAFTAALARLGYVAGEVDELLDACCGVLLGSRIHFAEGAEEGSNVVGDLDAGGKRRRRGSAVAGHAMDACSECAEAFGVSHDALAECLTHRTISVGGQALKANLNPADAEDCRDALAKHAYGALFRATVQRVNAALASASTRKGGVDYSIGALDIFGFEIFVRNSFEQLCINFCNEKLQQHFTKHTFDQEVAVYKAEGVPFAEIHYISNADVIELHYAGVVKYEVEGFLVKNKDRLYDDVADCMCASSNTLVANLFAPDGPVGHKKGSKVTCSGRFVSQLGDLMRLLNDAEPHYIRCIKPNKAKKPDLFEGTMCYDQLNFAGVFEAVTIRQQGYPFRCSLADFYRRFWLAAPPNTRGRGGLPAPRAVIIDDKPGKRRSVAALLGELEKTQKAGEPRVSECKVGASLVLWRSPQQQPLLKMRKKVEFYVALIIGTGARARLARNLRRVLAFAAERYAEAKRKKDPELVDAALAQIGAPRFESRDLRRLRTLKEKLAREKELDAKFEELARRSIDQVDDHFEALVEEGRRLELDSAVFKKVDQMYAMVVERRRAVEGAPGEPDEAALREALGTLERLVRIYGRSAMGAPEEAEGRALLRALDEEKVRLRELAAAHDAARIPPRASLDWFASSPAELARAAKALEQHRLEASGVAAKLGAALAAARAAAAAALAKDGDAVAGDDAWAACRSACAAALAAASGDVSCRTQADVVAAIVATVAADADATLRLCAAREGLAAALRDALAASPPDEAILRRAIAAAAEVHGAYPAAVAAPAELCAGDLLCGNQPARLS
ncbi:hypothetical protein AURANDRAFT_68696, partial [Aureococcus anophagefferens]